MLIMNFKILLPAKCILSGDYVVVNNGFAIICPYRRYNLELQYFPSDIKTVRTISGEGFNSMQLILWSIISQAFNFLDEDHFQLTGHFALKCTIPPYSGLGFYAALYSAVAEWLVYYGLLSRSDLFEFALKLESGCQIRTNGADIIGVLSKGIITYSSSHQVCDLRHTWHPQLYISSSGEKQISQDGLVKINEMRKQDPQKVACIDEQMRTATFETKQALESDREHRLYLLADALNLANECYYGWDLVSEQLENHINILRKYALACKILGVGYGGHVLSLWKEKPDVDLPFKLHRLII